MRTSQKLLSAIVLAATTVLFAPESSGYLGLYYQAPRIKAVFFRLFDDKVIEGVDVQQQTTKYVEDSLNSPDESSEFDPRKWSLYYLRGRAGTRPEYAMEIFSDIVQRMKTGPSAKLDKWLVVLYEIFYRDNILFPPVTTAQPVFPSDWPVTWNIGGNRATIESLIARNNARNYASNDSLPAAQKWPAIGEAMQAFTAIAPDGHLDPVRFRDFNPLTLITRGTTR